MGQALSTLVPGVQLDLLREHFFWINLKSVLPACSCWAYKDGASLAAHASQVQHTRAELQVCRLRHRGKESHGWIVLPAQNI